MRRENLSLYRTWPPFCSNSDLCQPHRFDFRPTVLCGRGLASREDVPPRPSSANAGPRSRSERTPASGSPRTPVSGARHRREKKSSNVRIPYCATSEPRQRKALMRVKTIDVLREVRKTLSDSTRWTTGGYARDSAGHPIDACDKLAASWCGHGAIYACGWAHGMPTLGQVICDDESGSGYDWARPLLDSLDNIAVGFGFDGFIDANDSGGRAEVLRVLDSAIAELEARGKSRRRPIRSAVAPRLAASRRSPSSRRGRSYGEGRAAAATGCPQ